MLETNFQAAVTQQHRILPIDGVINFRDLGGYQTDDGGTVRFGRVFRSAQLSGLTPLGSQQVASLAIESVADLRFDEEINLFPSVKSAFPKAEFVSWQDLQVEVNRTNVKQEKATLGKGSWRDSLDSHDPDQVREAMRLNYPQKLYSHQRIYKDILLRLMNEKSPLLFHCAAGKDRTGVAAAMVLSLIGVNDEQIIKDYLITAETTKGLLETFHAAGAATSSDQQNFHQKLARYPKHVIQPVFDTDPTYIDTLLEHVNTELGGFNAYAIDVLGLNADQLSRLKKVLVKY